MTRTCLLHIIKYTGHSRTGLEKVAVSTPGVGGNQGAGSIAAGGSNGLYNGAYSTYVAHKTP
jgi:hypothetical protein